MAFRSVFALPVTRAKTPHGFLWLRHWWNATLNLPFTCPQTFPFVNVPNYYGSIPLSQWFTINMAPVA